MVPNISIMENPALEMDAVKNGSHHHHLNLQGNGIGMMSAQNENSASPDSQSDASSRVTFNVGGSVFQTSEATLAKTKNRHFKVFATSFNNIFVTI